MSKLTDLSHFQLFVLRFAVLAALEDDPSNTAAERTGEDASAEIERRFGEGANSRLGDWFTATHASLDDMLWHSANSTDAMIVVARGDDPVAAEEQAWADRQFYGHA